MSERIADPRSTKRRPGSELSKDDMDEEEEESVDPGAWTAVAPEVRAQRRIVRPRGSGPRPVPAEPAAAADGSAVSAPATAAAAPAATANPFGGFTLTPPATSAIPANPFAGFKLTTPPAAPTTAPVEPTQEAAPASTQAAQAAPAGAEAAPAADKAETVAEQATVVSEPAEGADTAAAASEQPTEPKEAGADKEADQKDKGSPQKKEDASSTSAAAASIFGAGAPGGFGALAAGATGGFGGFGAAGAGSGFGGGGGFGGFVAAPFTGIGTTGGGFAAPMFSFGAPAGEKSHIQSAGQAFGSPQHGGEEEDEGAEQVFEPTVDYKPVVQLPEVVKQTGEEQEHTHFQADGALFEFDKANQKWLERGKGTFRVNQAAAGKARMLMRQTGSLRLLLNASVPNGMSVTKMPGDVGVTFKCLNSAGLQEGAVDTQQAATSTQLVTYAFRTKNKDKVHELAQLLQEQAKANAA